MDSEAPDLFDKYNDEEITQMFGDTADKLGLNVPRKRALLLVMIQTVIVFWSA